MGDQQYLVLDSPIPLNSLELGSLIIEYGDPTRNFFFDDALKERRKFWSRTDKNVEEYMTTTGPSQTKQGLTRRMLSRYLAKDIIYEYELQSLECRIYELINASALFQHILSIPGARLWARDVLKKHREAYLLTGYRTFRDGVLIKRRRTSRASTSASVSVSGIISSSTSYVRYKGQAGYRTEEEVIFAVAYRKIKLREFKQRYNVRSERGRDWLGFAPELRIGFFNQAARPSRDVISDVEASQSSQPEKREDGLGIRGSSSSNPEGHPAAEKDMQGSSMPHTSPPPSTRDQSNTSGRQDALHSPDFNVEAGGLAHEAELLNKVAKAIHELVIETDGPEESLQFEEPGVFQGDDHIIEIRMDDDNWSEQKVSSRVLIDESLHGVEDLFSVFIRNPRLQPLYARAAQVATEDVFRVMLNHLFQVYTKDLIMLGFTELEKSEASFIRARAPLVAALITRYVYSLRAEDMMRSMTSETGSWDLSLLIEEKDQLLYPFNETESEKLFSRGFAHTDERTLSAWGDIQIHLTRFLVDNSAFDQMQSRLTTFIAKQRSVRPIDWMEILIGNLLYFGLGVVLTLGVIPYLLFLLGSFPVSCGCVVAAGLIAQSRMSSRRTKDGILSRSPQLFSSRSSIAVSNVCQNPQRYLRIPAPSFVSALVLYLKVISRPAVRPGYRRIEWTCVSTLIH